VLVEEDSDALDDGSDASVANGCAVRVREVVTQFQPRLDLARSVSS
jgi:hypothetical protein